jgi:hypothetical protein
MKTVRGHAVTSSDFHPSKGSHARVSQFSFKTGGGAMADCAHGTNAIFLRSEGKDGWLDGVEYGAAEGGPSYPLLAIVFF